MRRMSVGLVGLPVMLAACGGAELDQDGAIEVGTGQLTFEALNHGEGLDVSLGPQGGHHVVVSFRVRDIDPGSAERTEEMPLVDYRLAVAGTEIDLAAPRRRPLEPSEESDVYEVVGHHLMVDDDVVVPLTAFSGTPLRLQVTVTDRRGNVRSGALDLVAGAL